LFENDRARVWEMRLDPGAEYPRHVHRHPYLSIVVDPASLVLIDERGEEEPIEAVAGAVFWREPPETHAVRNVGRTTFRNRLVEFVRGA
jgi:quercetin dioxygenase-like cupin family protein